MAIIVETGAVVVGANSYNTRAEFIAFALDRGVIVPDTAEADAPLVIAGDFMNTLQYVGKPVSMAQSMSFPRIAYECCSGELLFPSNVVPEPVKLAQLFLALAQFQGTDLMGSYGAGPALKRRKTGPMEREYFNNSEAGGTALLARVAGVRERLAPYLIAGGALRLTVVRV